MRTRTNLFILIAIATVMSLASCARTPEQKYARFMDRGKQRIEKKEFGSALLEFRSASQVQPKKAEPYYQLGLTYLAMGDIRSSMGFLRRAIEVDPNHADAQLKLAEMMTTSHNPEVLEDAEKRLESLLAKSPDNAEALRVMAQAELRLGKQDSAEEHLQQALAKVPQSLASSIALARIKLAEKNVGEAENILKKAVDAAPKSAAATVALGRFYLMMNKQPEAEAAFRRGIQIDPKDPAPLFDLATMQARTNRMDQAGATFKQLASLPNSSYRSIHAIFLFNIGKRDAAIQEFEQVQKQHPDDRENRTRLVMAYVAANRNPDAEKALAEALKRNPKDLDALELRSRLYLGAGNIDKAQEDAAQLIHFRADSPMAHYLMAKVHQAKRATGNYEQELGEALRLSPAFLTARLELSQSMRAANHAKNALELLEKAPDQQKQSLPVIVERNWVYLALGKEADLRAGIAEGMKFGRSPNLMLQDALLSLRGKNLAGARVTLEEILKQNPEDFRAFQVLLSTYVAQNQTAAALAKLKEYAAQRPKSPAMQFFVGQWMAVTGDRKGAREAFQQAKALNPAFREAEISLAQLDMAEGKLDAARQSLTRLASADSRNPALSLMLSMVEEKAGNYPAAVGHLRATVAADPSNVLAMNNLAYLLAEQMKAPDEALPLAQKALESDPKAPFINDTIGWVYYQKGMYRRAVQHIETAVAGQPTARRKYHLAMACEKNGEHKRAMSMLKEALTLDPNLPEAAAASSLVASSR